MRVILIALLALIAVSPAYAKRTPKHKPKAPKVVTVLTPSHDNLIRQNVVEDQMGLRRIQDEAELKSLVMDGTLVALPNNDAVKIAPSLPANRRYALPQTIGFLLSLAEAYRAEFGKPLIVDSAVRPVETQIQLRKHNRAAAPAEGETASSHETGLTIDLSKHSLNKAQRQWLEAMLSYEVTMNHAIVINEKACYHVTTLGALNLITENRRTS
jgi:hypothetical protein